MVKELDEDIDIDFDEIGDDEESGGSFEHYRFVADKGPIWRRPPGTGFSLQLVLDMSW